MKRSICTIWFGCWFLMLAPCPALVLGADPVAEVKIPDPEEVILRTADNVDLHATYYGGTQQKKSIPVILLHAWKGNRRDFDSLAILLQHQGHAVIVPDLRGHGESTNIQIPGDAKPTKLDAQMLRQGDFANMAAIDLETVKSFLVEKNNNGDLNIEMLCIVGMEMGAVVAVDWARLDWGWPPLTTGKQGQDVKALVLISPESNFKGMRMLEAANNPVIREQLAILIVAGEKNSHYAKEAKQLHQLFAKSRTNNSKNELLLKETRLQSVRLLTEKNLKGGPVGPRIVRFIDSLVDQAQPWAEPDRLRK